MEEPIATHKSNSRPETPKRPQSLLKSAPTAMVPPVLLAALLWFILQPLGLFQQYLLWAWEGTVLTSLGFVVMIVLHFLVPWNPNVRFVSDYARDKKYGLLMDWAFALVGVGSAAIGYSLFLKFGWYLLPVILYVCAFLVGLLSIFVCDSAVHRKDLRRQDGGRTLEGTVHDWFISSAFFLYMIGMLTLSFQTLGLRIEWLRSCSYANFNLALLCTILYIILGVGGSKNGGSKFIGLAERAVILTMFQWVGILAGVLFSK